MGDGGDGVWWIKIGNQQGGIQVSLDGPNTTETVMPSLREWLPGVGSAAVTVLGQLSRMCRNLAQDAAGPRNRALQVFYKHSRCIPTHTFTILFLPTLIGYFLNTNLVADTHDLMDKPPMET